ncbi:MAG: peptidase MA domain-containing protein [Chloroflexi bacterium]|nr:peptidase MA domain-containing protein [Chloroflexota bacterium]
MRKMPRILLSLAALLILILPSVMPVYLSSAALGDIKIDSSVQSSFPMGIEFKVRAESDTDIVKLRLQYKVTRQNYADVASEAWPTFTPWTVVQTSWMWDMRRSSLPPGAKIEYHWVAEDIAGKRTDSPTSVMNFDDGRYRWQSISEGAVTLLWYQGSQSFINDLMSSTQQALQRLAKDTGARPRRQVRIYIYANPTDLRGALVYPQEWTGGVTFVGFDVIAIGISQSQVDWGKRALAHELVHWLIHGITFNSYGAGLPVWLDEGLAVYGEGNMSPDDKALLDKAIAQNRLISVRTLSSPFSAIPEQAYLSYAESYSLVAFLIQRYGRDRMSQLLDVFRQGSGYDDAFKQVYGFDQSGLDTLWRASLGLSPAPTARLVPQLVPA